MANHAHTYKILFGNLKNNNGRGILSTVYTSVPFMIYDAKESIKHYQQLDIVLRHYDVKILTIDGDGNCTWIPEKEYKEAVSQISPHYQKLAKEADEKGWTPEKAAFEYFAKVYPETLFMEFEMMKAQFGRR